MCPHRGDSREDCILALDATTGRWLCWAHPAPPIPRQRGDLDRAEATP